MKTDNEIVTRLTYMDIAKGIGILCVIAGHMGNFIINKFVFSFHMPLFFLTSGYFISSKNSPQTILIKRFRQLLPPYVFTCFMVIFISTIKGILGILIGNKTIGQVAQTAFKWIGASLYGAGTPHDVFGGGGGDSSGHWSGLVFVGNYMEFMAE